MNPKPTPCPDCDPHGFEENLRTFYGPPLEVNGVKLYADPRVSSSGAYGQPTVVDAKSFARGFCPKHGTRSTSAKKDDDGRSG